MQLTEEVLETAERIDKIIGQDKELGTLWQNYLQVRVFNIFEVSPGKLTCGVVLSRIFYPHTTVSSGGAEHSPLGFCSRMIVPLPALAPLH